MAVTSRKEYEKGGYAGGGNWEQEQAIATAGVHGQQR